ncbi:acyl-CoA dehydrogenase family protein [Aeromicrobium wangtongii]|uniref:acyl-CoA dehydrogenase family protein n=1 Tax=Aeromicrobium wangtongii TaxID=2969247 RepID=UPI002017BAF0|nr:acyl-CoA dehydrogenase family protein [Aeromicrobium wangtongii]MCL3819392.1 acyl-CoA/acyl-ACP dehydrogenase [Aeromicrobium wangtongii]
MTATTGLTADELDAVVEVVDKLLASGPVDDVSRLRARLGRAGLWALDEPAAAALVVERLAGAQTALAWAAVQAHAAMTALGADRAWGDLRTRIDSGDEAVAVVRVDRPTDGVVLPPTTFARVDGAGPRPTVVALEPGRGAWVVPPHELEVVPIACTGLSGAGTARASTTRALPATTHLVADADPVSAQIVLHLGAAAAARGLARAAQVAAVAYADVRHQFGRPLSSIAAVQEILRTIERSTDPGHVGSLDPSHVSATTAAARAHVACEAAIVAASMALQVHGGYGYLTEYGAERMLRDAISLRAAHA